MRMHGQHWNQPTVAIELNADFQVQAESEDTWGGWLLAPKWLPSARAPEPIRDSPPGNLTTQKAERDRAPAETPGTPDGRPQKRLAPPTNAA